MRYVSVHTSPLILPTSGKRENKKAGWWVAKDQETGSRSECVEGGRGVKPADYAEEVFCYGLLNPTWLLITVHLCWFILCAEGIFVSVFLNL